MELGLTVWAAKLAQFHDYSRTSFTGKKHIHYFNHHLFFISLWCTVDCLLPNCSGNGVCVLGECVCYKGYTGTDCSIPDKINITHLCAKNCSGHGLYNVEEGKCECERLFTGVDCETGNWNTSDFMLHLEYSCCYAFGMFPSLP